MTVTVQTTPPTIVTHTPEALVEGESLRGGTARLRLAGELDLWTAESLRAAARAAWEAGHDAIEIDLSGVRFIDLAGARAVVDVAGEARAAGARAVVRCCGGPSARLFRRLGVPFEGGG